LPKMFAEEEWAEAAPGHGRPPALRHDKPSGKSQVISKRHLMQTLQTLGSVPVWDSMKPFEDSDEAMEDAPVHVNKTKKGCKKQKKIFDAESQGEQNGIERPVKRRKPKQKPRGQSLKTSPESTKEQDPKGQLLKNSRCPGDDADGTLSRQQWRNKMKNKKRCKNKFRHNSTEMAKINVKEGDVEQRCVLSNVQRRQSSDPSSARVRSGQKSGIGKPIRTHTSENVRATTGNSTKMPRRDASVGEGFKAGKTAVEGAAACPGPREPCVKQKSVSWKSPQLKVKKLRHILKAHITDSSKKLAVEKGETVGTDAEDGKRAPDRSSALRSRMEKRLESARFRYINELLYTSSSGEAKRMFKQDPDAVRVYHKGYVEQVKHWPTNPVDLIISFIQKKPQSLVVADFGCGDCKIARSVKNRVHCFDLAPVCDLVTACDMAKVPLDDCTVDIAVFCLSLMGTNLSDFLAEANRVLQMGGILKIAEVASRFDNIRQFTGALSHLGFKLVSKDTDNSHFYSFEFVKVLNTPRHIKKAQLQLRPCLYKKR
ncbi:hypothetical protein P4O66_017556, partial [Electrophorus voltai]